MEKNRELNRWASAWVIPLLAASLLVGGMLSSTSAEATTVLRLNLDGLLDEASVVVEGTVVSVANDEGDTQRIPTTVYEICDLEGVVGTHSSRCLTLRVPGGWRGDGYGGYAGMPQLTAGERYILFLTRQQAWNTPFVGWWQGVYHVVNTGAGPAILSSEDQPVTSIDAAGFVQTPRAVDTIDTALGRAEHVGAGHSTGQMTFAASPITRASFIDRVRASAQERATRGARLPDRLPSVWRCRDGASTPVTAAPPVVPWQEVSP